MFCWVITNRIAERRVNAASLQYSHSMSKQITSTREPRRTSRFILLGKRALPSAVAGASDVKARSEIWPNNSFQRTRVRSGCGLGPLNSKR